MVSAKHGIPAGVWLCLPLAAATLGLALFAMKSGSISLSWRELASGLFFVYDARVDAVYDLRFPRILIALLAGASLACSGLFLQAALKNPLADPGIIGISGGAAFAATLVAGLFPALFFMIPAFAFAGGLLTFLLIYALAWKGGLDPVRIILVGVAVSAVFAGLTTAIAGATNASGVSLSVSGLTQRSWDDVRLLAIYTAVGLVLSLLLSGACNLMALDDGTVRGLGRNADLLRFLISGAAVLLASSATAVVGVIGFLALLAPHAARRLIGSDHRVLTPFCILLGGFLLLLADSFGRLVLSPLEIPAATILNIVGGPFFIFVLRKGGLRFGRQG
ncbi:MAG: iron ABC transporter permease [Clostridiales Family XIII bacterium]|jgi:iron complex transport system permease protein|nr:iron ABC transporter permease [Clostridiales Family XIII bacterium]